MGVTVAVASMLLFAWSRYAVSRQRATLQKMADLEIVDSLIEAAMDDQPAKSVESIAKAVQSDMRARGYDPRVIALVTSEYVDELRRAKKRRIAADHQARDERKRSALRKGSPYRVAQPIEHGARKRNLEKLLETAGLDPADLEETANRRR